MEWRQPRLGKLALTRLDARDGDWVGQTGQKPVYQKLRIKEHPNASSSRNSNLGTPTGYA